MSEAVSGIGYLPAETLGDFPEVFLTVVQKTDGPLSKRISLGADGKPASDGSACVMGSGFAFRVPVGSLEELANVLPQLPSTHALVLGALVADMPDEVRVVTKSTYARMGEADRVTTITRTQEFIVFVPGAPAFALIDFDRKGMSPEVAENIRRAGGPAEALRLVLPEIDITACVVRRSTSSGLSRADTGEVFPDSGGAHLYVLVKDGADIPRFLTALHQRCWLHGFGWCMIGKSGSLLERSLIDRTVGAPERLVFEGAPILEPPLIQPPREADIQAGGPLDSRAACPDLTEVEQAKLKALLNVERVRLKPEAEKVTAVARAREIKALVARTGMSEVAAARVVESYLAGLLLPSVLLPFDDPALAGMTVAHVLADPARYVGETLADPHEGIEYGAYKAKVMRRPNGSLWIHSFAHGRSVYELKHDAAALMLAVETCEAKEAVDTLLAHLPVAEVAPEEEQALIARAAERAGVGIKPVKARIKTMRGERLKAEAEERRAYARAHDTDKRVRLNAPIEGSEWLPVLKAIDDVLANVKDPEPPMRDLQGYPVQVRVTRPFGLFSLEGASTNGEAAEGRVPAPEMPLLVRHNPTTYSHEIETHICYVEDGRKVALGLPFVKHAFDDAKFSTVPSVGAIATSPIVLRNGSMLAPDGLDRKRGIVFRISREMRATLPRVSELSDDGIKQAMRFLTDEWLCDVTTSFAGKCTIVAAVLTIMEGAILPERPAFFVTAGKRGGGKTTLCSMISLAATGLHPAAAQWAEGKEERRKALMAYLMQGLPLLVWDNIPKGATISCPYIEAALTAATYSDRILGVSETPAVPAVTVHCFTGNNVAAKGDLASRSLEVRIEVDRPDPENREFRHQDPEGWTLNHRAEILRALYIIMQGNPRLGGNEPNRTRFKTWYRLIGSAVEHAARLMGEELDFAEMFAATEENDEEAAGEATALQILRNLRSTEPGAEFMPAQPGSRFTAADIVRTLEDYNGTGPNADIRDALLAVMPAPAKGRAAPSAQAIGIWLTNMVGAPAYTETEVLVLRREVDKGRRNPTQYWVHGSLRKQ